MIIITSKEAVATELSWKSKMRLFNFLKKKTDTKWIEKTAAAVNSTVAENEKKYYQDDSYYTSKVHEGTVFERPVITFEERKKTAIPSQRGLYPAQILLLEYCSHGIYPNPKNGYPGFWWFEYGIRDVGAALKELETSGFIVMGDLRYAVGSLNVQELKYILSSHGEKLSGKKDLLIKRVQEVATDEELSNAGVVAKYQLTNVGKMELEENAYVPYMHKHSHKTAEGGVYGISLNVWSVNKSLGAGDKSNWKEIIDAQEQKMNNDIDDRNETFMSGLRKINPDSYKELDAQDQQHAACMKAQAKYDEDHDLDYYINFFKHIWDNGGLKFEGSRWSFKLADLYIKAKRYDDALDFVKMIKKNKPIYSKKADLYITKITAMKEKSLKRKVDKLR